MNAASEAGERAVRVALIKAAVVDAARQWEAWVVAGAVVYFTARIMIPGFWV